MLPICATSHAREGRPLGRVLGAPASSRDGQIRRLAVSCGMLLHEGCRRRWLCARRAVHRKRSVAEGGWSTMFWGPNGAVFARVPEIAPCAIRDNTREV